MNEFVSANLGIGKEGLRAAVVLLQFLVGCAQNQA